MWTLPSTNEHCPPRNVLLSSWSSLTCQHYGNIFTSLWHWVASAEQIVTGPEFSWMCESTWIGEAAYPMTLVFWWIHKVIYFQYLHFFFPIRMAAVLSSSWIRAETIISHLFFFPLPSLPLFSLSSSLPLSYPIPLHLFLTSGNHKVDFFSYEFVSKA